MSVRYRGCDALLFLTIYTARNNKHLKNNALDLDTCLSFTIALINCNHTSVQKYTVYRRWCTQQWKSVLEEITKEKYRSFSAFIFGFGICCF